MTRVILELARCGPRKHAPVNTHSIRQSEGRTSSVCEVCLTGDPAQRPFQWTVPISLAVEIGHQAHHNKEAT